MSNKSFIVLAIFLLANCSSNHSKMIELQPFGNFDGSLTRLISLEIESTYGLQIILLESKPLPSETFINIKSPRYRADKLIGILKNEKNDSIDFIMGLTSKDISTTKKDRYGRVKEPKSKYEDWGIFGLGYKPGSSSIVSTFRLQTTNQTKFEERLKKVVIHELGHNLGLDHCESEHCVMRDAVETIQTIDSVKPTLCMNCKRKI